MLVSLTVTWLYLTGHLSTQKTYLVSTNYMDKKQAKSYVIETKPDKKSFVNQNEAFGDKSQDESGMAIVSQHQFKHTNDKILPQQVADCESALNRKIFLQPEDNGNINKTVKRHPIFKLVPTGETVNEPPIKENKMTAHFRKRNFKKSLDGIPISGLSTEIPLSKGKGKKEERKNSLQFRLPGSNKNEFTGECPACSGVDYTTYIFDYVEYLIVEDDDLMDLDECCCRAYQQLGVNNRDYHTFQIDRVHNMTIENDGITECGCHCVTLDPTVEWVNGDPPSHQYISIESEFRENYSEEFPQSFEWDSDELRKRKRRRNQSQQS